MKIIEEKIREKETSIDEENNLDAIEKYRENQSEET